MAGWHEQCSHPNNLKVPIYEWTLHYGIMSHFHWEYLKSISGISKLTLFPVVPNPWVIVMYSFTEYGITDNCMFTTTQILASGTDRCTQKKIREGLGEGEASAPVFIRKLFERREDMLEGIIEGLITFRNITLPLAVNYAVIQPPVIWIFLLSDLWSQKVTWLCNGMSDFRKLGIKISVRLQRKKSWSGVAKSVAVLRGRQNLSRGGLDPPPPSRAVRVNSHIQPNCLSRLVPVSMWPDNRGQTIWRKTCASTFLAKFSVKSAKIYEPWILLFCQACHDPMSMTTQICACRTVLNHLFPIFPNLQVTVMHSMQAGYMDKAQKYTDKALLQISKLKILDSHPILSSFQLMLLEHIIMCRLVMGHKSLAVQEVSSYLYHRCRIHIFTAQTLEDVWLLFLTLWHMHPCFVHYVLKILKFGTSPELGRLITYCCMTLQRYVRLFINIASKVAYDL